jgi:DNA-binding CsgD family transcriptional regulator
MIKPIGPQLARFGAETASFVTHVLGADWSCFYYLDERSEPFGFQPHRTPRALRESYLEHAMSRVDPLHPTSLVEQNIRFVSMFDSRLSCSSQARRDFWNFLATFGSRDAAEMLFRVRGRAVAGLSLIWVGESGRRAERQPGDAVQSYVEFNLASRYLPGPANEFPDRLHLTDRELEIVQLVCRGSTNVQIAQRLKIGVSTVKTHLLHVFEKSGVQTRAALVSRFLSAGLSA